MTHLNLKTSLRLLIGIFLLMFIFSPQIFALPEDDQALIYIKSDSFHMENLQGLATYTGHVIVDQGTRHLTANILIIHRNQDGQLDKITALGTEKIPATFKTLPKPDNQWVSGYGLKIYFYPLTHDLEINQDAYLTQSGNSFSGAQIFYNTWTEIITSPDSQTGQSLMVLQPAHPKTPINPINSINSINPAHNITTQTTIHTETQP